MSLGRARKYFTFSRTVVPLLGVYTCGNALGQALYFATDHLWMFSGPLGDLRRAGLEEQAHYPTPFLGSWLGWLVVALFAGLLMAELGRHRGRSPRKGDALLVAGFFCGGMGTAAALLGPGGHDWAASWPLLTGTSVLSGGLLAAARWRPWRGQIRHLAIAVWVGGVVLALITLRLLDSARLG